MKFFLDSFRSTFLYMFDLSRSNLSNMVFEHFWNSFDLKNSISGSIQLHQLSSHVVVVHIPKFVTRILGAFRLFWSLQVVYGWLQWVKRFINSWVKLHVFSFAMCSLLTYHHIILMWWLWVVVNLIHGIWITLDVHPNWVVLQMDVANTFNTIFCKAMFQKLQVPIGQLF